MIHSVTAKKNPEYVYSKLKNGCLVHRVAEVRFHWRDGVISHVSIETKCHQIMFSRNVQLCAIPRPDAVDCGRCYGAAPTFRKNGSRIERKEAHEKLGCMMEAQ